MRQFLPTFRVMLFHYYIGFTFPFEIVWLTPLHSVSVYIQQEVSVYRFLQKTLYVLNSIVRTYCAPVPPSTILLHRGLTHIINLDIYITPSPSICLPSMVFKVTGLGAWHTQWSTHITTHKDPIQDWSPHLQKNVSQVLQHYCGVSSSLYLFFFLSASHLALKKTAKYGGWGDYIGSQADKSGDKKR